MGGRGGSSITSKEESRQRAENVLQAMRDAGMKPVKSVAETEQILKDLDKKQATFNIQRKARINQANRDRARRQAEQKKYSSQNDQVRQTMNQATRLATAGNYKEAEKLIKQADKLNDGIPSQNRLWNTKTTPKKIDLSFLK